MCLREYRQAKLKNRPYVSISMNRVAYRFASCATLRIHHFYGQSIFRLRF